MEGDALGVVLASRRGLRGDGYAGNLLKDINQRLQMLEDWKLTQIFREGNDSTDYMVVGRSNGNDAEYVIGNSPSEFYNLVARMVEAVELGRNRY